MLVLTLIVERVCRIACIIHHVIEVSDRISQPSDLLKLKGDAHRLAFFIVNRVYCTLLNKLKSNELGAWSCQAFPSAISP